MNLDVDALGQSAAAWLVTFVLWEEQVDMITRAVRLGLKEPITRGEHDALLLAQAQEWVPVDELADVLTGDYSDWSDEDFEEADGERLISDAAWDRVCAEKERELRRLVAASELKGRGRGANLRIQAGAFDAHFGRTTAAMPEDLLDFRMFEDDQANEAATEKARQQRIFDALEWRRLSIKGEPDKARVLDKLAGALRTGIAGCYAKCWQQVRACELAIEEMAAAFNGIDPLRPHNREVLDGAKEKLVHLQRELEYLGVKIETPEPDDELMGLVQRIARQV